MEETKVEVKAVEEKPAKRTYNRQKKTETVAVTKDTETIKVDVEKKETKTAIKVADEVKQKSVEDEAEEEEVKVAEAPAKKEEIRPEKPVEKMEAPAAVLSIEKPEIGSDEPNLKASYLIRKPVMIYFVPKVSEHCKMFVGVVRVLAKVDDKFVKIAYRANGSGEDVIAYILNSSLPQ